MTTSTARDLPEEAKGMVHPGINATLFDTHVELASEDGLRKSVSIHDYVSALTNLVMEEGKSITVMPPTNCYIFSRSVSKLELACYYPGKLREITFMTDKITIPFPNIIISHSLSCSGDKFTPTITRYLATYKSVGQLPEKVLYKAEPQQGIWIMPLPNTYSEGNLCYGNNSMPRNIGSNLRPLDWYFMMLYKTPFNRDLLIPSVSNSEHRNAEIWMKLLSKQKTFPYKHLAYGELVPDNIITSQTTTIMAEEVVPIPEAQG